MKLHFFWNRLRVCREPHKCIFLLWERPGTYRYVNGPCKESGKPGRGKESRKYIPAADTPAPGSCERCFHALPVSVLYKE